MSKDVKRAVGSSLTLTIPNSLAGLKEGLSALRAWLLEEKVSQQAEDRAFLVFEEIVTNIIRYGFDDSQEHVIGISFARNDGELTFVFDDDGRPFDPRKAPLPEKHRSLDKAPIGGRGLFLVRKAAKWLDYERTQRGHNRLTIALPLA